MKTQDAIQSFLSNAESDGKSQRTIGQYSGYLRHFAAAFANLPQDTPAIETYLKLYHETPAHRGMHFSILQAFYSFIARTQGITSPVPPRGKTGRPARYARPTSSVAGEKLLSNIPDHIETGTAELVEKYKAFKLAEGVTKRTTEQYQGKLGAFIKRFPVLPLDPDEIAAFLAGLKCDQETKWDYRKHIVSFYHFLERRRIIPLITVNFPKVKLPRKTRRVLSEEEVTRLFEVVERFEDKVILTLLLDAKIRATELCTLTRENIFPDHIVVTGKTGQRQIPISPLTYGMINKLEVTDGPLFTVEGRPMRREHLRVHLHDLMQKAGLTGPKLGPHILRHSSSVFHIMHGGDLLSLQQELGHSSLKMTEHYAQLAFPEVRQKHQEVNVIGHLVTGGPPRRAVCFGCNQEVQLQPVEAKHTKCPGCGQVGRWYIPEYNEVATK